MLNVREQPGWEGTLGRMDTFMPESLFCSSETIITLFIGYTPVQNKKFKKKKGNKSLKNI